jgi:hypothetical protein
VLGKDIATGRRKRHEELLSSPKWYGRGLGRCWAARKEGKEGKEREVLGQKKRGGPGGEGFFLLEEKRRGDLIYKPYERGKKIV